MIVECPHCFYEFDVNMSRHEDDTGFYCPDCGSGFLYSTEGVS